jgi:hypothetical protein
MRGAYQLWYVRQGDKVSGPFPPQLISRYVFLGRIRPEDEASPDKINWLPIGQFPELLPKPVSSTGAEKDDPEARMWQEERVKAARRWEDERTGVDRRAGVATPAGEDHRLGERRRQGLAGETLRVHYVRQSAPGRAAGFVGIAAVMAFAGVVAWVALSSDEPVKPVKVGIAPPTPSCASPAAPYVNWSLCNKEGAWLQEADLSASNLSGTRFNSANLKGAKLADANLSGADLSYADLSGAVLSAANLGGADLTQADLRESDLRGANLRNAKLATATFDNARLGQAIWADGRICAPDSLGRCL